MRRMTEFFFIILVPTFFNKEIRSENYTLFENINLHAVKRHCTL